MSKSRMVRNYYVNLLIVGHQPNLSSVLLTSLQWGLGYQEQEICDTGMGQPAITPDSHLYLGLCNFRITLFSAHFFLCFNPKVRPRQTMGLEKLKHQDRLSFASWCTPACIHGLAETWKCGAGPQSGVVNMGREGKGMRKRVVLCCQLWVLYWILIDVLIETWAWGVCL